MRKASGFTIIELLIIIVIIAILASIAYPSYQNYKARNSVSGDSIEYQPQDDYTQSVPVPAVPRYFVCVDGTPPVTTLRVRVANGSDWSLENGTITFTDYSGNQRTVEHGTQTCKIESQ